MIKKFAYSAMAIIFIFVSSGCATIVSGRYQKIPVVSNPSGAKVFVNGVEYQTPHTLVLNRNKSYKIRVEKEGYEPVEKVLRISRWAWDFKKVNGWYFGNLLLLPAAPIGATIDFLSGAVYKFSPSKLEINLAQQKPGLNGSENKDIPAVKTTENAKK